MEKTLVSFFVFIVGLSFIYIVETCNYPKHHTTVTEVKPVEAVVEAEVKKPIVVVKSVESCIKKVMYDYRSAEPTLYQLDTFLTNHLEVTAVIRLNSNRSDSNGLTVDNERKICDKHKVNFWYFPMFKPYGDWAEVVTKVMCKETVLVHCHYGYDRTGFVFAYKLMKYHGYTFEQIQELNGWDEYDTYSRKFYPTLKKLEHETTN